MMKKILLLLTLFIVSGFYTIGHNQSGDTSPQKLREAKFTMMHQVTKTPVTNQVVYDMTGKELGVSDLKGMVTIAVPSSKNDAFTIEVKGFDPVDINLKYATKKSSSYEILLSPAEEEIEVVTEVEVEEEVEKVKVYVKQDPTTYVKQPKADAGDLELVFAVQLSASSRPVKDLNSLSSWEKLGPLYVYTENGLYKVRIGPFDTQDEAKHVLLQAKEKGKKDAFIVIQEGLEGYEPQGYVKYEEPMVIDEKFIISGRAPVAETAEPIAVEEASVQTPVVPALQPEPIVDEEDVVEYKVRLASYLKPGGFNTKDIDQYGPLESYRKGEWTIMLIGGFKTLEDAKRVQKQVIAKGYKDALIVADRGGILEDVK